MEIPWTDKARKAIALAVRAAQQRAVVEVTPGLLLLGLLELPRSVAGDCLRSLSVDPKALRCALIEALPQVAEPSAKVPPMSAKADAVVRSAERLVQRLEHESAGTDALLVGILEQGDAAVEKALAVCLGPGESAATLKQKIVSTLRPLAARAKGKSAQPKGHPRTFEDALQRWEPAELLAQAFAFYEERMQEAIGREDFAAAAFYRDRIRQLRRMTGGDLPGAKSS